MAEPKSDDVNVVLRACGELSPEALVALRLATAKRGDYARPLPKRYDGAFARFSPPDRDEAEALPNLPQPHIHTV